MRATWLGSLAVLVSSASVAVAQITPTYTTPTQPDSAALARLNLKTEWAIGLPLLGRGDAVTMVQVLDGDQFVVQTRSGFVAMMDSRTGAKQWSYQLPAPNANVYPIGFNDRYIFVLNVVNLFCFERSNGLLEFNLELKSPPTIGPMADRDFVYVTTSGNRLSCYRIPEGARPGAKGAAEKLNLATQMAQRAGGANSFLPPRATEPSRYDPNAINGTYSNPNQKTPSVAALPSVTPPYSLEKRKIMDTPSISVLPSVRQPYHFRPEHLQYNQITPSVAAIPPSIYRVHELANFRPKPVPPSMIWSHSVPQKIGSLPVRVVAYPAGPNYPPPASWYPDRIWLMSDHAKVLALSGKDGSEQVTAQLRDSITTPLGGPMVFDRSGTNKFSRPEDLTALGFVGLTDGTFIALDLGAGGREAERPGQARTEWKTNLGAPATNKPLVTETGVYASGEHAGVTKLNPQTGEELWETESVADRLLAVNDEYAYVLDRMGGLRIYDNKLVSPGRGPVPHLAKIDVPGFNVPVMNEQTDRIFLVSQSGLMICLRDAAGKYARPQSIVPSNPQKYAPKPPPAAAPMEGMN